MKNFEFGMKYFFCKYSLRKVSVDNFGFKFFKKKEKLIMDLVKNLLKGLRENELMVYKGKLNDICKCMRLNFKKMNFVCEILYI